MHTFIHIVICFHQDILGTFTFIHIVICFHEDILDMYMLQFQKDFFVQNKFQKKFQNIYLDIYVIREEDCMQMSVDHVLDPE